MGDDTRPDEDPDTPDQGSTTGTTPSGEFVGRVAGQDVGYSDEQGADRLAAEQGYDVTAPP